MNKDKLGKVGGQAVIEGVMMQSQDYRAIAVRKSDGEIEVKKERIKSWVKDKKIDKILKRRFYLNRYNDQRNE